MIHDQDRSGWIGASDTYRVMSRWNTKTFEKFWLEKLGLCRNHVSTYQMKTGSAFEHRILDAIGVSKKDRQIRKRRLRLRVNLDGEDVETIYEVKTYGGEKFKVSPAYWQQAQVEMYATGKKLVIVAYRLEPEDYGNWLRDIDPRRTEFYPIEYDDEWVRNQYLPRLRVLADALKRRTWPDENAVV